MTNTSIHIRKLTKTFHVKSRPKSIKDWILRPTLGSSSDSTYKALDNIDIDVKKGEKLGIIGHNGAGKSTLIHCIMGTMRADRGSIIQTEGKMMRLALGLGFDPQLTGKENIYVNGSLLGLTFRQIGNKYAEILDFSGLEKFIDQPVKIYSNGMKARLMFAIAIHANADVLLLDEFFGSVGDTEFRKKSFDYFKNRFLVNKSALIVGHQISLLEQLCDRIVVLENGKIASQK